MTGYRALAVVVVAVGFAGCSWTQAPQASDDFSLVWTIQEPTRTVSKGEFYITDGGYWAYKPHDRDTVRGEISTGELTVLKSEHNRHYFAVVETARWGYRLQRLDDRPLQNVLTGDLLVLNAKTLEEHDDLCIISDVDDLDERCGLSHRHRRWDLFEIDDSETQSDAPPSIRIRGDYADFDHREHFPVLRNGIAGGDILSTWWEGDADAHHGPPMLAIRTSPQTESTLRATVAYDDSCGSPPSPSPLVEVAAYDFDARDISLPTSPHPITIEDAALRLGVDTILTCHADTASLLVPMLSRPLLYDADDVYFAPPAIGVSPRMLDGASPASIAAWTRAGALTAVGDFSGAAFWVEQAVSGEQEHKTLDELALTTMPLLTAAGRPELAMHIGSRVTRGSWNPENIPDYLDGLIVLLAHFGDHEDLQSRVERRQRLAGQRFDSHRVGWYKWADLRQQLAEQHSSYAVGHEQIIASLEDRGLEGWTLAVWATLVNNDVELPIVDDPDELDPRFSDFEVQAFWRASRALPSIDNCPGGATDPECQPTSYGWSKTQRSTGDDIVERLRTLAPIALRGGFAEPSFPEGAARVNDGAQKTAYWLASAALVPPGEFPTHVDRLMDSLLAQFEHDAHSLCDDLPQWQARFENAAARTRSPSLDRSRTRWITTMEWWTDHGLQGLCDGPEVFLTALEDHGSTSNPWTRQTLPFLEYQLLEHSAVLSDTSLFARATDLARSLGADDTCTLWSLGVSIGAIRAGYFDAAESHLVSASNCLQSDSPYVEARNLVAAYLDFERGGGRTIIRDGGVEQAIATATRRRITDTDACVGLRPMGFQLEQQLPPSVMRIAARIQLEPAPHDSFALSTASRLVAEAHAAYLSGLRDLHRGQLHTSARALQQSRANLRRIGNLPGLARIGFLDQVVFDGNLDAVAENGDFDLPKDHDTIEMIRSGETYRVLAEILPSHAVDDDIPLNALIAALLIDGQDSHIAERFDGKLVDLPALCDAEEILFAQQEPPPSIEINGEEAALEDETDEPVTEEAIVE